MARSEATRGDRVRQGWPFAVACVLVFGALPLPAHAQDLWVRGSEWLSVRAGYAKSSAIGAPDGNFGIGFGYARFRNTKWSFGAQVAFDVLGRYGDAVEIESPWTLEALRHYRWKTAARPYIGLGAGAYYNKISGTGDDHAGINPGVYLASGFNSQISDHGLFGFDVRMSWVELSNQDNPVFGAEATLDESQKNALHWSAKATYSWGF